MSKISPTDQLGVASGALAEPTRRAIVARLARGEASVTELAQPFDLSLPGVSKHLKVLQRAGWITQGRNAQWRPCRLEAPRLKDVSEWVGEYRRFWEVSGQRLAAHLRRLGKDKNSYGRQQKYRPRRRTDRRHPHDPQERPAAEAHNQ